MVVEDEHHRRTLSRNRVDNGRSPTSLAGNRSVRGVWGRALQPPRCWEGRQGIAMVANRIRGIQLAGMIRGALGNMAMVAM
jgi:hypothetical protein